MAATLHSKINRKRLDKLDIIKIWWGNWSQGFEFRTVLTAIFVFFLFVFADFCLCVSLLVRKF